MKLSPANSEHARTLLVHFREEKFQYACALGRGVQGSPCHDRKHHLKMMPCTNHYNLTGLHYHYCYYIITECDRHANKSDLREHGSTLLVHFHRGKVSLLAYRSQYALGGGYQ